MSRWKVRLLSGFLVALTFMLVLSLSFVVLNYLQPFSSNIVDKYFMEVFVGGIVIGICFALSPIDNDLED